MSSRNVRKRGRHVGLAMLAIVSIAIFAAQLDDNAADADTVTALNARTVAGIVIAELLSDTRQVLEETVPELNPALVEVTTDESRHPRQATASGTEIGGRREAF